jgi:Oligoribonuclease (3''->5'' exoribonuclease)
MNADESESWSAVLDAALRRSESQSYATVVDLSRRRALSTHATLLVLDAETTGLDVEKDVLMEVGSIASTQDLVPIASLHIVLCVKDELLTEMDSWCQDHHGKPREEEKVAA